MDKLVLFDIVESSFPSSLLEPLVDKVKESTTLCSLVLEIFVLARALAVILLESEINRRAKEPAPWPSCPKCGAKIENKGFVSRSILTLVGKVSWKRRVGRCPQGCKNPQFVPFDKVLGITPGQKTSTELKRLGVALAVFVPFDTAAILLGMLVTGVSVSSKSIWGWVSQAGSKAMQRLAQELQRLAEGIEPSVDEKVGVELAVLPLILGGDGVMAPFRPVEGKPSGKTVWREVKVGILARLGKRLDRKGKEVTILKNRRVVAVLGCNQMLGVRLLLESLRQGIRTAPKVVWMSDGGAGFWTIYKERLAQYATHGILDFYHAAQNLWKAAKACLDGETKEAKEWFKLARHRLRHGKEDDVLKDIEIALNINELPESSRSALLNLHDYLGKHRNHINYAKFKDMGLPIGSGFVESACKWLVQQRFKGVGMRWSEEGFSHLLHVRLAWCNSTFDELFYGPPN